MKTVADFLTLLPLIVVAYGAVLIMVAAAFWRSHKAIFGMALFSLAAAFSTLFVGLKYIPRSDTALIRIDAFSEFVTGFSLLAAFFITLLSRQYVANRVRRAEAYYILILLATTGMVTIACSAHFVSFILGVEILSVSLYALVGYFKGKQSPIEASIKYLVLAAVSIAFLLFGVALLYAEFGTMDFRAIPTAAAANGYTFLAYLGYALIIVGLGFKLAAAPFHFWAPDVYQGAPPPVAAFIASGAKGAVFAIFLRLFANADLANDRTIWFSISFIAVATMFTGNFLALLQPNLKRLLAYSSVAHIGYLLIPLLAGTSDGNSSALFYVVSYSATTIAAFGAVTVVSCRENAGDLENLESYRGLAFHRPAVAAALALAMLSLTGIPMTSGFFAKFLILTAAFKAGLWPLVVIALLNSGISAFYYLRVLAVMYSKTNEVSDFGRTGPYNAAILAACATVMLVFGVFPTPLINLAEIAAAAIGL